MNDANTPFIQSKRFKGIMLLGVAVLVIVLAGMLNEVFTPLLIAFILAYIFEPLITRLEKLGIRRIFGVIIIYILIFMSLAMIGLAIFPKIANQSTRLYRNISASKFNFGVEVNPESDALILTNDMTEAEPDTSAQEQGDITDPPKKEEESKDSSWIARNLGVSIADTRNLIRDNADKLANKIAVIFTAILQKAAQGVGNVILFIFSTILVFIFAFFFMLHFKTLTSRIRGYIPAANRTVTLRILRKIDCAVSNFFRGRLLVCLIAGIVSSIGFFLSGLDYWLLLGLAAGILGFIPIIGVIVSIVPAAAFAMLTSHPVGSLIGVAATFCIVQMVVEPLIGTLIMSREVKMHPAVIILALLLGARLFGAFGMILSIPMAATVKILTEEFILPSLNELAENEDGDVEG